MSLPLVTRSRVTTRLAAIIAIAGLGVPLIAGTASAASDPTGFGFRGSGYSAQVLGGPVPVDTGRIAYVVLPCTSRTGVVRTNSAATTEPDGVPVSVGASTTTVKSMKFGNGFATASVNDVADVRIGDATTFLQIEGLRTFARAGFYDGAFRPFIDSSILDVDLVLAGVPTAITVQQLREGFTLPGIATVTLGGGETSKGDRFAEARATGLFIELLGGGDPTTVTVGRAYARIDRTTPSGAFSGGSQVARVRSTSGLLQSGPLANRPMPCPGTNGRTLANNLVDTDPQQLGQFVRITGGKATVFGKDFSTFAIARGEATVEKATLFGGRLRIDGVEVKASVRANDNGTYQMSTEGTTLARIRFDGVDIALPDPGESVTIPNIAQITFRSVTQYATGIQVVGVKIKLLDGRASVIELARVRLFID